MSKRHAPHHSADYEYPSLPEPSAWSRTVSNAGTFIVTTIMVGGIWWWTVGVTQPKPNESPTTAESQPAEIESPDRSTNGRSTNGDEQTEPVVQTPSANGAAPSITSTFDTTKFETVDFDASRTSWQDPFDASHWESDGWTFQPEAMQSRATQSATAMFRRDYRKITIECRIAPVGASGVFQIRLFAPQTDALMQAEFSREAIKISSTIKRKNTLIKQRRFSVPLVVGKPTTLRLTATGNRVLVFCNGKQVINCSQPVEQSGKPLQFSLHTEGGAFRISRLGLEGE